MKLKATRKLRRLKVIEQEPIREEIADVAQQIRDRERQGLDTWTYLPERLIKLKAEL